MKVTFENLGSETIVRISGRLDTSTTPECEREFKPLLDGACQNVLLDCSGLLYVSSSGLRVLLKLQKAFVQLNKKGDKKYTLRLTGLSDDIREVLTVTGFVALFTIV